MPMTVKDSSGNAQSMNTPGTVGGMDRVAQMMAERRSGEGEKQAVQPPAAPHLPPQQDPQTAGPQEGQTSVTEPAPVVGEEGVKLESLTGQETDEQLAQVVPSDLPNDRKYERIRKLAVERNQAVGEMESLRQKAAALEAQLQAFQKVQETAPSQPPPVFEKEPFPEPEPKREDFEETDDFREARLIWKASRKNWDYAQEHAQKHAQRSLQAVASFMKPYVEETARSQTDKQWKEMDGLLKRVGISREEIQPAVQALIQRDPSRSLRGAVVDVLDYQGLLNEGSLTATNGHVPSTSTPGSGRTQPATSERPAPPSQEDQYRSYLKQAMEYGQQGRTRDSLVPLANALSFKTQRQNRGD